MELRPRSCSDGRVCTSDGDWVYLFFDVLLYLGTNMDYNWRQCIGVMFGNHIINSHEDDCFAVEWQKSYPAREFCRVFEEEQDVYNVEGVVFKRRDHMFKWNFQHKQRAVLQMQRGRRENGRIVFDLAASDSAKIASMTLSEQEFCSMMLRQPLPRMECWWRAGEWTIAKPCIDRDAACAVAELDAVKRATQQDISIEKIRACFNTKRA